ncbi:MAG: hypothetical protein JO079_13750 [Frankiaceae bacterium]|nr:hypothetical protein [Frankiaceae bacterium]
MSAIGRQADVVTVQDTQYRVRRFDGVGLTLGLRADLYARTQDAVERRAIFINEEDLAVTDESTAGQRADGSLVRVEWTLPEGYGDTDSCHEAALIERRTRCAATSSVWQHR